VFDLSFGQLLWSRRSLFLALLAGAPILMAVIIRLAAASLGPFRSTARGDGVGRVRDMIWLLYIPLHRSRAGVFYGPPDRRRNRRQDDYLSLTRPIPRSAALLGKYVAYVACTILLVLPSVCSCFSGGADGGGSIAAAFPSLVATLHARGRMVAYGAVFAFVAHG